MQYWDYLDRSEDDGEAEESTLDEVQSDFDGASDGQIRQTNPRQQAFDFYESLSPNYSNLDEMSGFQERLDRALDELEDGGDRANR